MAFKNRKKNYPLYETTHFRDTREMTENIAARYPDRYAITYRRHPSDADALKLHNITDAQTYFEEAVKQINQKNVSYKTVGKVKLRDSEFPKNTSRKITRFAIDKSID